MAFDKSKSIDDANRYLQKGQIDKALREYDRILQHDPKDVRVRQKLAELLARRGRVPEAMREFQAVADSYERSGFFPKASAIYKQMLRLDPDSIPLHLRLGEIYHQLGMRSDAAEHFRRVASHVEKKGSVNELLDIHKKLAALNPDDAEARFKLAELYLRHGDPIGAAQLFREMAAELEKTNQVEDLVRVYERLVSIDAENLDVYKRLASLHLLRNDARRALQRLQVCFKADPQDTETLTLLAQAFGGAGEVDKAIQVYEELQRLYEEAGETELADSVQVRLEELDPSRRSMSLADGPLTLPLDGLDLHEDLPEDLSRLLTEADVYFRYGLADRARDLVRDAAARSPSSFAVHRLRARLHALDGDLHGTLDACQAMYRTAMDRGEMAVARAALAASVEVSPGDTQALARLQAFDDAMGPHLGLGAGRTSSAAAGRPAVDPMLASAFSGVDDGEWDAGGALSVDLDLGGDFGSGSQGAPAEDEMLDLARELEHELTGPPGAEHAEVDEESFEFAEASNPPALDDEGDDGSASEADPYLLGRSYFDVGLYDEARAEFQKAAESGVQVASSLEMIGVCLRKKRLWDAAVLHFQQALQSGRLDTEAMLRVLFELGVTYEARGDKASAYRVYQRLINARPDYRDGEVGERLDGLAMELGLG